MTRTHTVIDAATGDIVSITPIDDPPPGIDSLPDEQAEALIRLGVGLASDAGALWDALEQIAPTNTARPSIDIITHHALEAGLALTDQGDPT